MLTFSGFFHIPIIPTAGKNFKKIHGVRVTCPWSLWKYLLLIFIAAVVREIYSFNKIMQFISPTYSWENRVKQIKITEENLSQSSILYQLLRTKTIASGSKCIKHFFIFITIYLISAEWMSGCDLLDMSLLS